MSLWISVAIVRCLHQQVVITWPRCAYVTGQ